MNFWGHDGVRDPDSTPILIVAGLHISISLFGTRRLSENICCLAVLSTHNTHTHRTHTHTHTQTQIAQATYLLLGAQCTTYRKPENPGGSAPWTPALPGASRCAGPSVLGMCQFYFFPKKSGPTWGWSIARSGHLWRTPAERRGPAALRQWPACSVSTAVGAAPRNWITD